MSISKDSFKQTRQIWSIIFLICRLAWWNKFFLNYCVTVKECEKDRFVFYFWNWFSPRRVLSSHLRIILEASDLLTRCSWAKQGMTMVHRWKIPWQACSLGAFCSSVKQIEHKPPAHLPFSEISRYDFTDRFSANLKSLLLHPKNHLTNTWTQFPNCFHHVRQSNCYWASAAFVIFEISTAAPKSFIPLGNAVYIR